MSTTGTQVMVESNSKDVSVIMEGGFVLSLLYPIIS